MDELKAANDEIRMLRAKLATGQAGEYAARAADGVLVCRVDAMAPADLRDLAVAIRQRGVTTVVLGGVSTTGGVSLVAAVDPTSGRQAAELLSAAAKAVGGGGGGKGDVATAGGKRPEGLDEALMLAEQAARS